MTHDWHALSLSQVLQSYSVTNLQLIRPLNIIRKYFDHQRITYAVKRKPNRKRQNVHRNIIFMKNFNSTLILPIDGFIKPQLTNDVWWIDWPLDTVINGILKHDKRDWKTTKLHKPVTILYTHPVNKDSLQWHIVAFAQRYAKTLLHCISSVQLPSLLNHHFNLSPRPLQPNNLETSADNKPRTVTFTCLWGRSTKFVECCGQCKRLCHRNPWLPPSPGAAAAPSSLSAYSCSPTA